MIVLYQTIPASEIRKNVEESIPSIERWFQVNPKKKICNARVWYNRDIKIRRGHVRQDMEAAANEAIGPKAEEG